ncbi:MAG: HAMP domain-containing histidine kinase [Gemmatimonadetes bacterium]|nr:HAMP domain-containing histidine kinase [Gemmatimonadota bacterium]
MSTRTEDADRVSVRVNKLDLLERLADDLAHEIKNPLHSMVINLEVLKRRIARAHTEEQGEMLRYAGVVGSELERASQRIELLLRMIRPGRGADAGTLNEIVEELLDLLTVEIGRRAVRIRFDPEPLGARTYISREPVRQVMLNLVLEVLDTLSAGDSLHLRVEPAGSETRFVVMADTGSPVVPGWTHDSGSPRDSDAPTSRLPIARALGEALGGRVEAERTPDGTMLLSFFLPGAH